MQRLIPLVLGVALVAAAARADERFPLGVAAGFAGHEGGHLLANAVVGGRPEVRGVKFLRVPFFAISPTAPLSPRALYAVSVAGFLVQDASSEWILSRTPGLRDREAPFAKGVLTFHVSTSAGYAGAAFARRGPAERDTRSMATTLRVSERWVGALVLAPAALDLWRYHHPRDGWATWTSRATKVATLALLARARKR
jgi:hypothetical protein